MADEDQLQEIEVSAIIQENEGENNSYEIIVSDNINTVNTIENSVSDTENIGPADEIIGTVDGIIEQAPRIEPPKLTRLPMARTKIIMRMDPDVNVISSDAVYLVTKATELFLETLAKETFSYTAMKKRKTIAKKDLDTAVNCVDCLCFLEGALDF